MSETQREKHYDFIKSEVEYYVERIEGKQTELEDTQNQINELANEITRIQEAKSYNIVKNHFLDAEITTLKEEKQELLAHHSHLVDKIEDLENMYESRLDSLAVGGVEAVELNRDDSPVIAVSDEEYRALVRFYCEYGEGCLNDSTHHNYVEDYATVVFTNNAPNLNGTSDIDAIELYGTVIELDDYSWSRPSWKSHRRFYVRDLLVSVTEGGYGEVCLCVSPQRNE